MGTALAFYFAAAIALIASVRVITNTNPVHALLYLVVSLLAVAMIFFALGAPFAAALEMIVYAGAIMVLFVFVVMILNLGAVIDEQEKRWLSPRAWIGPTFLSLALFAQLIYTLKPNLETFIEITKVGPKEVGIALFGPYVLAVELASMLLLAAMVAAWHIGRDADKDDNKEKKMLNGIAVTHGIPMEHGLLLAAALFVIGLAGVLIRRNLLFVLMSIEIMMNACALAFVVAGARWVQPDGQVMFILILTLAASEAAIGLAIVIQLYRRYQSLDVDAASEMRG